MKLSVKIRGDKEVVAALNRLRIVAAEKARTVVNTAALDVQREAKRRCPVDIETLRSSIRATFYRNGLAAEIGTDVGYAPYVEFGTSPHFPPSDALTNWARRHKMSGAQFVIARAISQRGTAPKPFLFPAWEEVRPRFISDIKQALRDAGGEVSR